MSDGGRERTNSADAWLLWPREMGSRVILKTERRNKYFISSQASSCLIFRFDKAPSLSTRFPAPTPPIHFCLRCWVFCRGELWKGEKWGEWGTAFGLYFLHKQSQQKRQWALQHSGFNASVLPCRDQNPKLIKLNSDEKHSCLRSATKQSANYLN